MATIGEVNAQAATIQEKSEPQIIPYKIYFGVFFDGTSNNMIQVDAAKRIREKLSKKNKSEKKWEVQLAEEERGIFENGANVLRKEGQLNGSKGYSNVAVLHSIYNGIDKEKLRDGSCVRVYNIYVEGAGTEAEHYEPDTTIGVRKHLPKPIKDKTFEKVMTWKGGVSGKGYTGVVNLVSKAIEMVATRLEDLGTLVDKKTEIHFDVFGFSRGATCARLFSFLIARNGDENAGGLPSEAEFAKSYISSKRIKDDKLCFIEDLINKNIDINNITIDFLGIFDTVSSIGGIKTESYDNNTTDFGLYSPILKRVEHTFHLCAMDEFRAHFALTDIGDESKTSRSAEIFIPGCHSDVGGGYIDGDEEFNLPVEVVEIKSFNENEVLPMRNLSHPLQLPIEYVSTKTSRLGKLVDCMGNTSPNSLGWLGLDGVVENAPLSKVFSMLPQTIKLRRKSKRGYSNIPLSMMHARSLRDTKRDVFNSIPTIEGFGVSENLKKLFGGEQEIKRLVSANGRHFYYPGGKYNSREYNQLREFLHFSAKDELGHDMSIDNNNVVRRYVYHGNQNNNKPNFVSEYELTN